ncbi:MAG TPA: pyridoxamine 5'-phosphate oxidase family protein, partial [Hyphomicrobiaceae bacterium]|nr:pyridoxamine 5'-phosphate oxidase family protein [Hyphomicrobiaceae bacterium]
MAETPAESAARATRYLMRRALKASLATLEKGSGHPYVSLVTVATEADGAPILLLSSLAVHTRNLMADSRASL